ncbi:MAG: TIGR04282 family arsenosugar biosynthesis glycosyltransferase [Planctomycetota bacterium]
MQHDSTEPRTAAQRIDCIVYAADGCPCVAAAADALREAGLQPELAPLSAAPVTAGDARPVSPLVAIDGRVRFWGEVNRVVLRRLLAGLAGETHTKLGTRTPVKTQLGVFAKFWAPGSVKTRLAATLGEDAAAMLAKRFIETLIERLAERAERCVVGFSPANARTAFSSLCGACWSVEPQPPGDLGQRMQQYFADAFASGVERVVLLGADSPDVPLEIVGQAFDLLARRRLVLGPADDGGYYLIGASGGCPPVFDGMPWSSERLWAATTERLASLGWREGVDWQALPAWYDIDTHKDLVQLGSRIEHAAEPALRSLSATIAQLPA